jgi:hypothetical protein
VISSPESPACQIKPIWSRSNRPRLPGESITLAPYGPAVRFHERLLRAIEAGRDAGGQHGGQRSAGLLIHSAAGGVPYLDLRVDEHPEPVGEIRRIHGLFRPLLPYYELMRVNPGGLPPYERGFDYQRDSYGSGPSACLSDQRGGFSGSALTSATGICTVADPCARETRYNHGRFSLEDSSRKAGHAAAGSRCVAFVSERTSTYRRPGSILTRPNSRITYPRHFDATRS